MHTIFPPRQGIEKYQSIHRMGWLIVVFFFTVLLSSCSGLATATPEATLTPSPTATPTPEPLGSAANPVKWGVVYENKELQSPAYLELTQAIIDQSGISIQIVEIDSYAKLADSFLTGKVHLAWLPPLTYLYLSQKGSAEAAFLTNHFGVFEYGTQIVANNSSRLVSYFDETSGKVSADAKTAFKQLDGLRPCLVEPNSLSGYILPIGLLVKNDIAYLSPVVVQSHPAVIRALYIKGICDYGATFAISGDPRTASAVQQDLPDALQQISILWKSDPIIPNLNLSFNPILPEELRSALTSALLDFAKDEKNRPIFSTAANYEIQDLKQIDDSIYDPLRGLVDESGVDLKSLLGW